MELFVFIFVYYIVGLAYVKSFPRVKIKFEWVADLIIAPIWPVTMLQRFFAHREYVSECKRLKAYNESKGHSTTSPKVLKDNFDSERAKVLLQALLDMMDKQKDSHYTKSIFELTAIWDNAECDGYCLYEEVKALLEKE